MGRAVDGGVNERVGHWGAERRETGQRDWVGVGVGGVRGCVQAE